MEAETNQRQINRLISRLEDCDSKKLNASSSSTTVYNSIAEMLSLMAHFPLFTEFFVMKNGRLI